MADSPDLNGIFARSYDAANGAIRVSNGAVNPTATLGYATLSARPAADGKQGLYYATDGGTGGHGALYFDHNGTWAALTIDASQVV